MTLKRQIDESTRKYYHRIKEDLWNKSTILSIIKLELLYSNDYYIKVTLDILHPNKFNDYDYIRNNFTDIIIKEDYFENILIEMY